VNGFFELLAIPSKEDSSSARPITDTDNIAFMIQGKWRMKKRLSRWIKGLIETFLT